MDNFSLESVALRYNRIKSPRSVDGFMNQMRIVILLFKGFVNMLDFLRAIFFAGKNCVLGFYNNCIFKPYCGNKF